MLDAQTSLLANSDGSAQLSVGGCTLVVSVLGPIEPKAKQELPNCASLELVIRPAIGLPTTREKLLEDRLRSVLQGVIVRYKYPRQLIQVVVQFISVDGHASNAGTSTPSPYTCNELSAAINCCFLALVDANVALHYSFAATSAALLDGQITYVPETEVLKQSLSHHVLCFSIVDKSPQGLVLIESQGEFTEQDLFTVISELAGKCKELHSAQRLYIENKVKQDFRWKP